MVAHACDSIGHRAACPGYRAYVGVYVHAYADDPRRASGSCIVQSRLARESIATLEYTCAAC